MKSTTISAIRQIIKLLEKQGLKYELTINNGVVTIVFSNDGQKNNMGNQNQGGLKND